MPELYTIGYEGSSQDALLSTLRGNEIDTLLDIRELPLSRKPGFSKTALASAAQGRGIRYEHLRALGTPRDIRHQHRIDHDEAAFRQNYLAYLETQNGALNDLVARVTAEPPIPLPTPRYCLLCYEADPEYCHRLLVAERVRQESHNTVTIVHLQIS